ncbi:50S ribosomal protein L9 [Thioploca ingrica]|uniref:Large ribosomal subunit protein bL9 n=1 Tax=Thioploca ingrica TaxID=40754 RepID=A0A090AJT1_9GAMM|nr:50S ribosomal protein L9 [Thioploca ingrica]
MEVILLEKIKNLGNLGDKINVKPGHARNYLIPQNKAALATPANIAEFDKRRSEFEKAQRDALTYAQERATQLKDLIVEITGKVGVEGKLFGSVNTTDIAQAINGGGVEISKHEIRLPNGPLRHVGEYEIAVHLHPDVDASITVHVVAEE